MDENYLLNLYLQTIEYFSKDLGFKPFRENPDSIIVDDRRKIEDIKTIVTPYFVTDHEWIINNNQRLLKVIIHRYIKHMNTQILQRIIIIKEALLSFIPDIIRKNPLLNAMVLYRIAFGKSIANIITQEYAKDIYEIYKKSFEESMISSFTLLLNYQAFSLIFPYDSIEKSFKQYLYTFASFSPIISNDDSLINAIIEDIALKNSLYIPLNFNETKLLSYFCRFFHEKRLSFTPDEFLDYLRIKISKKDEKLLQEYFDIEKLRSYFEKLSLRGISFVYRIDYPSFGYEFYFFIAEFKQNIDQYIINNLFNYLPSLFVSYDNYSMKNFIRSGILINYKNNLGDLNNFFSTLKNKDILEDFLLFPYDALLHTANLRDLSGVEKYKKYLNSLGQMNNINEFFRYSKESKIHPEYIDFIIFRLLSRTGTSGFGLKNQTIDIVKRLQEEIDTESNILNAKLVSHFMLIKRLQVPIQKTIILDIFTRILKLENNNNNKLIDILIDYQKKSNIIKLMILCKEIKKGLNLLHIHKNDSIDIGKKLTYVLNLTVIHAIFGKNNSIFLTEWFEEFEKKKKDIDQAIQLIDDIKMFIEFDNINIRIDSIQENMEKLQKFQKFSVIDLKSFLNKRIKKYIELNVIYPFSFHSIYISGLNCIRLLILKNNYSKQSLKYFLSIIPYCTTFFSNKLNDITVIQFKIHSNMDEIIYNFVVFIFNKCILYYGTFFGSFNIGENRIESIFTPLTKYHVDNEKINYDIITLLAEFNKSPLPTIEKKKNNYGLLVNNDSLLKPNEKKSLDLVVLKSNLNRIMAKNQTPEISKKPSSQELIEMSLIFSQIFANHTFIPKNSKYVKIHILPDYGFYGFSYYILTLRRNNNRIFVGEREISTQEMLTVPGCFKIEGLNDIFTQNIEILHYIFPYDDFCSNLINYCVQRKLICVDSLLKVKRKLISFFPNYFVNSDGWSSNYSSFDVLIRQIINEEVPDFNPKLLTINLDSFKNILSDNIFTEINVLKLCFGKNISNVVNLKSMSILNEMIDKKVVSIIPMFDSEGLCLDHKLTIFVNNVNEAKKNKLIMIFSLLPYITIDECVEIDYTKQHFLNDSLIINVYLPNEQIDKLHNSLLYLFESLNINEVQIMQNLVEINIRKYTNQQIRNLINPFDSHYWDANHHIWRRLNYFDSKGRPISHKSIIDTLNFRQKL